MMSATSCGVICALKTPKVGRAESSCGVCSRLLWGVSAQRRSAAKKGARRRVRHSQENRFHLCETCIPTELDSESSRHNGISLGIIRQVPRNYISVSWRAARDAPIPATPAHARTRRTRTRARSTLLADAARLQCKSRAHVPKSLRGTRATRSSPVYNKGIGRPPLPTRDQRATRQRFTIRESAAHQSTIRESASHLRRGI